MDLRFVAFDLIARDATLRTLLANYAKRLEAEGAPEHRAESCFVSLRWTVDERVSAPAGSELLTVQVHVSRGDSCPPAHLDGVLQRLRAALTAVGPNPCITARCLTTSGAGADSRFGTLFKTSTWVIATSLQPTDGPIASNSNLESLPDLDQDIEIETLNAAGEIMYRYARNSDSQSSVSATSPHMGSSSPVAPPTPTNVGAPGTAACWHQSPSPFTWRPEEDRSARLGDPRPR